MTEELSKKIGDDILSSILANTHMFLKMWATYQKNRFRKQHTCDTNEEAIDFVVTWIDGNDPNWKRQMNQYKTNVSKKGNGEERFRDWNQFQYWFRAVEKYAPWVRKIFLVTWGHIPEWLNLSCPKLVIVKHQDFIPEKYLPTFSSVPIHLNIHRIPGLSEKFVLFDDDMYLSSSVKPDDFFEGDLPRVCAISYPQRNGLYNGPFSHQLFGDIGVINGLFDVQTVMFKNPELWFSNSYGKDKKYNYRAFRDSYIPGMFYSHLPIPLRKTDVGNVWNAIPDILDESSSHKFRTYADIERFVFTLWEIMMGYFSPVSSTYFGKAFGSLSTQQEEIDLAFYEKKHKCICLNDSIDVTSDNFNSIRDRLDAVLRREFPQKSQFEL